MEFQIKRNGKNIGRIEETSVKDGLTSGFLRATDHFLHEGMKDWELLGSKFPIQASINKKCLKSNTINNGPVGVRGWLLIFCIYLIGSILLSFLISESYTEDRQNRILDSIEMSEDEFIVHVTDYVNNIEDVEPNELLDTYLVLLTIENLILTPFYVLGIIIGILIFLRVRKVKIITLIFLVVDWLILVIWGLFDFVLQTHLSENSSSALDGPATLISSTIILILSTAIYAAWFVYFLKSKRVKNTLT